MEKIYERAFDESSKNEAKGVLNYESSDEEKDIIKATPSSRK